MASEGTSLPEITLTEVEDELRRLLLDVASYINPEQPTDLRYTGGWVRDKLLGVGSHDIDVGISDMTGYQFGVKMKEYLDLPGNAEKYGIEEMTSGDEKASSDARHVVRGLHKIEANPEKSKHLETVTTKIFGLDIDLVNLRKETYAEDSRNPAMEFGSPEEDALRRDATMNAMFYNLKTQAIEDFTHHGWEDMQQQLIKTPLDPYQTFKDDPLRILRLVRFASRLGYKLDPAAETSMQDPAIREALKAKISRERVGVELEKMLKGPDPHLALSLIHRLGLYSTIFTDPDKDYRYDPDLRSWSRIYDAARLMSKESSTTMNVLFAKTSDQAYIIWTLSSLVPWTDAPITVPLSGKKSPPAPAVGVARNGIKAPNKLADIVRDALTNVDEIIDAKVAFLKHCRTRPSEAQNGTPSGRDTLGMLIRKWGSTWTSQVAFALMVEATRTERALEDLLSEYGKLLAHIRQIHIEDATTFKPIIDGNSLAKELNTKPGVWMKAALDEVMAWQLAHPDDANPKDAIEVIRRKHGELTYRLVTHFLALTIRPLFAQTKTQSELGVTQQSHRALGSPNQPNGAGLVETIEEGEAKRPWKQEKNAYALELLRWCVSTLQYDKTQTSRNWPLLVPPVLALVDDVDIRFKAMGCNVLSDLLRGTDAELLKRTGLAEVFEKAVTPCLSYLPTLTAERDSVMILDEAYPAMLALCTRRYRVSHESEDGKCCDAALNKQINYLLHRHLLPTFSLASHDSYPTLTTSLLRQLDKLISSLRLNVIGQTMHILPFLTSILSTPFASAAPDMISQAAKALQVLIANAWPRIWRWRSDILASICRAWLTMTDAGDLDNSGVASRIKAAKQQLRVAKWMLVQAVEHATGEQSRSIYCEVYDDKAILDAGDTGSGAAINIQDEIQQLRIADSRLEGLFNSEVG